MLSFLKLKGISKDYLEDKYFFFFLMLNEFQLC